MSHARSRLATLVVAGLLVGGSVSCGQSHTDCDDPGSLPCLLEEAEQGLAPAQFSLGGKYQYGVGVPENDIEAVRWFRLAAAQGDHGSQLSLGLMYLDGEGVPQNNERAYMWFSVAATVVDRPDGATTYRDQVSETFTPEQLSRAQALATTCFNSNFTDCGEPE